MKQFLVVIAVLLMPVQAFAAATITITIAATGLNTSVTKTLTDAEATRIVTYVKSLRAGSIIQTPAVLNPDGSIKTPAVMRDPTPLEAIQFYFGDVVQDMAQRVTQSEQQKAAVTGASTVVPVNPQ